MKLSFTSTICCISTLALFAPQANACTPTKVTYTATNRIPGLCSNGVDPVDTVYEGEVCDEDGNIQWLEMTTTNPTSSGRCDMHWDPCTGSPSHSVYDSWKAGWVGGCGVAPAQLTNLPTNINQLPGSTATNSCFRLPSLCGLPTSAPSSGGGMMGDPHVLTFAGDWFDFHGECDLVLLHAPKFDEVNDVDVHCRTTIRYDYSYIEAAAIRIGDDILEVGSFGDFALNGVSDAFSLRGAIPTLGGHKVIHTTEINGKHTFSILLAENENITITTFKDWVNVRVFHDDEGHFGAASGLMGNYHGELVSRDGSMVASVASLLSNDRAKEFGQEWQVMGDDPNLFRTARAPVWPQACRFPGDKDLATVAM